MSKSIPLNKQLEKLYLNKQNYGKRYLTYLNHNLLGSNEVIQACLIYKFWSEIYIAGVLGESKYSYFTMHKLQIEKSKPTDKIKILR